MKFEHIISYGDGIDRFVLKVCDLQQGTHEFIKMTPDHSQGPMASFQERHVVDGKEVVFTLHDFPDMDLTPFHADKALMERIVSAISFYAGMSMVTFISEPEEIARFIKDYDVSEGGNVEREAEEAIVPWWEIDEVPW